MTSLSWDGAGVLVRSAHPVGERMTVTFALPRVAEAVTVTGTVRWAGRQGPGSSWHPLGLEWLPTEEVTRNRLREALSNQPESPVRAPVTPRRVFPSNEWLLRREVVPHWTLAVGLLAGAGLLMWVALLHGKNRRFAAEVLLRQAMMQQLEQHEGILRHELAVAGAHLSATTEEVSRLAEQAQFLEGEVGQLRQDVEHVQASYRQAREEREQLMQRVLDLAQERVLLTRRLTSMKDLDLAIHEALAARVSQRSAISMSGVTDQQQAPYIREGNRGYVVQKKPVVSEPPSVRVRVHEPVLLEDP